MENKQRSVRAHTRWLNRKHVLQVKFWHRFVWNNCFCSFGHAFFQTVTTDNWDETCGRSLLISFLLRCRIWSEWPKSRFLKRRSYGEGITYSMRKTRIQESEVKGARCGVFPKYGPPMAICDALGCFIYTAVSAEFESILFCSSFKLWKCLKCFKKARTTRSQLIRTWIIRIPGIIRRPAGITLLSLLY